MSTSVPTTTSNNHAAAVPAKLQWITNRRLASNIMLGVGAFGVLAGLLGIIIGWLFISQTERTASRSLDVTVEAVSSAAQTVDVAHTVIGEVASALTSLHTATTDLAITFDRSQQAFSAVATFTGTQLPNALQSMSTALPLIAGVGDKIDAALRALSRAPLGITYAPTVPLGDSIRQLATAIQPLPDQLRSLSTQLQSTASSTSGLGTQLQNVNNQLGSISDQVNKAQTLLDQYSKTAQNATAVAKDARSQVHSQARNGRILVVFLALALIALQVVPLWLALMLRSGLLAAEPEPEA